MGVSISNFRNFLTVIVTVKSLFLFFTSFSNPCLKIPIHQTAYRFLLTAIVDRVSYIGKCFFYDHPVYECGVGVSTRRCLKNFRGTHDSKNFDDPCCSACLLYFLYIYFLFLIWHFYYIKEMPFNLWNNTFGISIHAFFFKQKQTVYWENSSCLIKCLHRHKIIKKIYKRTRRKYLSLLIVNIFCLPSVAGKNIYVGHTKSKNGTQ